MGEEGPSRPSWYDVVSFRSLVFSLQIRKIAKAALVFVFCEFPVFLVKLVSEELR